MLGAGRKGGKEGEKKGGRGRERERQKERERLFQFSSLFLCPSYTLLALVPHIKQGHKNNNNSNNTNKMMIKKTTSVGDIIFSVPLNFLRTPTVCKS